MTPCRPYAVMATPSASCLTYEPFLTRASMEALGWSLIADAPGYHPAAERCAAFDALPAVERWWATVWQARAGGADA